jgi:hypothetical protein
LPPGGVSTPPDATSEQGRIFDIGDLAIPNVRPNDGIADRWQRRGRKRDKLRRKERLVICRSRVLRRGLDLNAVSINRPGPIERSVRAGRRSSDAEGVGTYHIRHTRAQNVERRRADASPQDVDLFILSQVELDATTA